jgi:uncharacterized membrane protein YiaA
MSFILLWIETLLATTLFAAMMITPGARRESRLTRVALYAVGLGLPALFLGYLVVMFGLIRFVAGLRGHGFWMAVLLLLAFVASFVVVRTIAVRPDATGLRRAMGWSVTRITTAFLVCLTLLGMTFWNLALQAQVEIQDLRTQAGALALSVAPPPVPDSQNAFLVYQQATERYQSAATEEDKQTDLRDLDPRSPQAAAYLERQKKTLELIRRAADMPQFYPGLEYAMPTESDMTTIIDNLPPIRAHANLLVLAAKAQAAERPDLALDDCRRLYAMANQVGTAPMLLNGLVSIAVDTLASRTTAQILPAMAAKEPLDRFPALDPNAINRMYARCLTSEEAFSIARFCDIANGQFTATPNNTVPRLSPVRAAALWMVWLRQDVVYYRESMQRVRALAAQPYFKALPGWKQLEAEKELPPGQRRGILTATVLPSFGASTRNANDAQALRACTTVALAATRYRLAHTPPSQYPDSAQALVPEFLDAVPLDPFDGQPLRYKKNDDASLTIYSIGPDLTDNHGDVEPKKNAKSPDTGLILKPPS